MKIIQIIQRPQLRGAEIFACQLAHHLSAMGHELRVIALFPGNARLPFSGTIICLNRPLGMRLVDIPGWWRLNREIRAFSPDIVQANAGDTLKVAVLSRIIFRWPGKLVYRNANMMSQFMDGTVKILFNKFLLRFTDHVISVAKSCNRDLTSYFGVNPNNSDTIPVGVEQFYPIGFSIELQEIKSRGPLLVNVAGLVPEKNHLGLLRIFSDLRVTFPTAQLLVIGTGKLEHLLIEYAAALGIGEAVHFLGVRTDVREILSGSTCLLLPSLIEGLPAVVLEAMASSCPVIAYDVGGIAEVIHHQVNGMIVNPGQEREFSRWVIELLNNPALRSGIVKEARISIEKGFKNQGLAIDFIRVYERVIGTTI